MNQFWKKIWEMCLLKAAPQDIPASSSLLIVTLCCYFVVSFLLAVVKLSIVESLGAAAVDVVFLLFISYVIMWVKLTTNRWYQTATSMAGVCTLIGVIALPIAVMQVVLGTEDFALLFLVALMVWNLVAIAHVFKHAMDVSMIVAGLLAGFYMYLSLKVMNILFFQAE